DRVTRRDDCTEPSGASGSRPDVERPGAGVNDETRRWTARATTDPARVAGLDFDAIAGDTTIHPDGRMNHRRAAGPREDCMSKTATAAAAATPTARLPFKVKDLALAELGRKE